MAYRRALIDGYSLLHRDAACVAMLPSGLHRARQCLIQKIERGAAGLADRITIVFDGQQDGGPDAFNTSFIEVLYTRSLQSADSLIERIVHDDKGPSELLVVTSDRLEREVVTAAEASAMSCTQFLELLDLGTRALRSTLKRTSTSFRRPTLGEFFQQS